MCRPLYLLLLLSALALAGQAPPAGPSPGTLIPRPEAFTTLVNPNCSHCIDESKRRAADLRADDRVLCWTRGKYDGGAIPVRFFLAPYRVISDTYGVFVYDPDAGFARGFAPSLDFRFHGWRNGVMVMRHKDGTLYSSLTGVAFDGPRKGDRLKPVPTLVTDWGLWLKRYPGAVAYHMFDKYKPVELPAAANEDSVKSRGKSDPRLPADELVLGVRLSGLSQAYPIAELARAGRFAAVDLGGTTAVTREVVLWYGPTKTAAAYFAAAIKSDAEGRIDEQGAVQLTVDERSEAAPFRDRRTGSHFDVAGRGVDGPLKGRELMPLDALTVKWFAWAAEYPDTGVVGR
jgi:hypothetical protein